MTDDKRFKKDHRHLFGQTALMDLQFRTHNDHGTAGIVHTFTQQVLTETALLTFEHIRQTLESAISGTGHCPAVTAVIQQRINRFLEHAFFVADDDFRRIELQQVVQTVVAVDDTTVEIVACAG